MKKLILVFLLSLISLPAFSQKSFRFGDSVLRDTLNGSVALRDKDNAPSSIYGYSGTFNSLHAEDVFSVGESAICSVPGAWEFLNPVTFNDVIEVDSIFAQDWILAYEGLSLSGNGVLILDSGYYDYGEFSSTGATLQGGNIIDITESSSTLDEVDNTTIIPYTVYYLYFSVGGIVVRDSRETPPGIGFRLSGGDWTTTAGDILAVLYIDGVLRELYRSDF